MDSRLKDLSPDYIARTKKIFPAGQITKIYKSFLTPKPTTFRVNTLKSSEKEIESFLQKNQITFEKEKAINNCYYFKSLSLKKIKNLKVYQNGEIYLQNLSSQIPPLVLSPKNGDSVLDLCASPGSKTLQISALMQNNGTITALEPDLIRFKRLNHNIKQAGAENITTINQRGESFCKQLESKANTISFAKILVDAPCSGDGTIYINDRSSFAYWSIDFSKKMAKLQKKLLNSVVKLCKQGGLVVYSTCSISPEENEGVVDDVLRKNPKIKLIDVKKTLPLNFFSPPLAIWQGTSFLPQVAKTARIYPSLKNEGFFIALLRV